MEQSFLLYLALLLVVAKLIERILSRGGISPLVAHIMAGIILGPYVLKLITPSTDLQAVSYLGLLLLMFYTGLTTNFGEMKRLSLWIVAIGISGVLATISLSYLMLTHLGFDSFKALIISILISNTATETTAAVVSRSSNETVRSISVGASVVDDILAVVMLGIITSAFTGTDTNTILNSLIASIALLFSSIALSEFLIRNPRLFYYRIAMNQLTFASTSIILASVFALLARLVGLNELIGAYLAGLIVGRGRESHDPLLLTGTAIVEFLDQLRIFLESLALPLFFTYVGLLVSLQAIDLELYFVLLLVALAGKIVGCGLVTYVALRDKAVATAVAIAMTGRGVLETALLKLLLDTGILKVSEYSTILLVALSTTVLAPIMYGFVMRYRKEV